MERTITARFGSIVRYSRLSANGNPRYMVHTDKGSFATEPDAQVNYVLPNHDSDKTDSWIGLQVTFTRNDSGNIIGMELAK